MRLAFQKNPGGMVNNLAGSCCDQIGAGVAANMAAAVIATSQPNAILFRFNQALKILGVNSATTISTDYKRSAGRGFGDQVPLLS